MSNSSHSSSSFSFIFLLFLVIFLTLFIGKIEGSCAPERWSCEEPNYGSGAACDGQCGLYDPDCNIPGTNIANCELGQTVSGGGRCVDCKHREIIEKRGGIFVGRVGIGKGECVVECPANRTGRFCSFPSSVPPNWECDPKYYNAGDGCHCGCKAFDPDCEIPGQEVRGCPEENMICLSIDSNFDDGEDLEDGVPGICTFCSNSKLDTDPLYSVFGSLKKVTKPNGKTLNLIGTELGTCQTDCTIGTGPFCTDICASEACIPGSPDIGVACLSTVPAVVGEILPGLQAISEALDSYAFVPLKGAPLDEDLSPEEMDARQQIERIIFTLQTLEEHDVVSADAVHALIAQAISSLRDFSSLYIKPYGYTDTLMFLPVSFGSFYDNELYPPLPGEESMKKRTEKGKDIKPLPKEAHKLRIRIEGELIPYYNKEEEEEGMGSKPQDVVGAEVTAFLFPTDVVGKPIIKRPVEIFHEFAESLSWFSDDGIRFNLALVLFSQRRLDQLAIPDDFSTFFMTLSDPKTGEDLFYQADENQKPSPFFPVPWFWQSSHSYQSTDELKDLFFNWDSLEEEKNETTSRKKPQSKRQFSPSRSAVDYLTPPFSPTNNFYSLASRLSPSSPDNCLNTNAKFPNKQRNKDLFSFDPSTKSGKAISQDGEMASIELIALATVEQLCQQKGMVASRYLFERLHDIGEEERGEEGGDEKIVLQKVSKSQEFEERVCHRFKVERKKGERELEEKEEEFDYVKFVYGKKRGARDLDVHDWLQTVRQTEEQTEEQPEDPNEPQEEPEPTPKEEFEMEVLSLSKEMLFAKVGDDTLMLHPLSLGVSDPDAFSSTTVFALMKAKDMNLRKVLLDFRGITQSSTCQTLLFFRTLFKYFSPFPISLPTSPPFDFRKSDLISTLAMESVNKSDSNQWSPSRFLDFQTGLPFENDTWIGEGIERERKGKAGTYSQILRDNCEEEEKLWEGMGEVGLWEGDEGFVFDRAVVLTDGICTGLCGLAVNYLKVLGAVTTVSIGGYPKMGMRPAIGLSVPYSLSLLRSDFEELGLTEKAKSLTLPFTSELIFSMKEYYPQLESDLTDPKQPPVEELILPADYQIQLSREISPNTAEFYLLTLKFFSFCKHNNGQIGCRVPHGRGKQNCTRASFDPPIEGVLFTYDECFATECDEGYHALEGKCVLCLTGSYSSKGECKSCPSLPTNCHYLSNIEGEFGENGESEVRECLYKCGEPWFVMVVRFLIVMNITAFILFTVIYMRTKPSYYVLAAQSAKEGARKQRNEFGEVVGGSVLEDDDEDDDDVVDIVDDVVDIDDDIDLEIDAEKLKEVEEKLKGEE